MSDLCPQCGGPAFAPSERCDVVWHKGTRPLGTSVVQDIDAQLEKAISALEGLVRIVEDSDTWVANTMAQSEAVMTLAELKGEK
jgi:hypothetical protein